MKNQMWFIFGSAALVAAFLVHSSYMAFAVYAFILLVAIARLSSIAWLSGLDCERVVSRDILRQGETTEVEVTVTNRRGFPVPWIFCEDLYPPDFARVGENVCLTILMPGRSIQMRYELTCSRRGYHRIGPIMMESGDLFGLQKRFRTGRSQNYISVLPTVAYIDTFNISSRRPQGPVRITNRIYDDPTRIVGAREYVPGDPLNRIHWKATARTGSLYSKIQEPSSVSGGTLILDLHEDSFTPERKEERLELAITTTASIAYLLQVSGEQVGMLTNARDAAEIAQYDVESKEVLSKYEVKDSVVGETESQSLNPLQTPTLRAPGQAQHIIENLARVIPTTGLTIDKIIMAEFEHLPRDAALLPVVPQVTEQLALTLSSMKLSGFNVSVFLIANPVGYQEAAALLASYNINCFHIEHERNLHEISPAKIGH
jgi:hypothetical protein